MNKYLKIIGRILYGLPIFVGIIFLEIIDWLFCKGIYKHIKEGTLPEYRR